MSSDGGGSTKPEWESPEFIDWLEAHDSRSFVRDALREWERRGYDQTTIQALRFRLAVTPGLTVTSLLGGRP